MNARSSLGFAIKQAAKVLWGGIVASGLFAGFIIMGPGIEGQLWPVTTDYRLHDVRAEPNGGVSFTTSFTKVKDCTYYGVTWFAPDLAGNSVRIQIAPLGRDASAPQTGPMGRRVGDRQVLYPPADATAILAIQQHDCGWPWQTRTTLGPFPMIDGLPSNPPEG